MVVKSDRRYYSSVRRGQWEDDLGDDAADPRELPAPEALAAAVRAVEVGDAPLVVEEYTRPQPAGDTDAACPKPRLTVEAGRD